MVTALFELLGIFIRLYTWALVLTAVISMLIAFNVLDTRNRLVWTIADFLHRITEPALRPIRRWMPNFGNIDLSPLILIVVLQIVGQYILPRLYAAIVYGAWQSLLL